jgi:hypothetical protein
MKTTDCPQKILLSTVTTQLPGRLCTQGQSKDCARQHSLLMRGTRIREGAGAQASMGDQQPAEIRARHRPWGMVQERLACDPARPDNESFCSQEQPGKRERIQSQDWNEMLETRSHLLRANPGYEQQSGIEGVGFSSSSSHNIQTNGSNIIGIKGHQGFERGWTHFGDKCLLFNIPTELRGVGTPGIDPRKVSKQASERNGNDLIKGPTGTKTHGTRGTMRLISAMLASNQTPKSAANWTRHAWAAVDVQGESWGLRASTDQNRQTRGSLK